MTPNTFIEDLEFITEKWLADQEARAQLCAQVILPGEQWRKILTDIRRICYPNDNHSLNSLVSRTIHSYLPLGTLSTGRINELSDKISDAIARQHIAKGEWQPIDSAPKDGTQFIAYMAYDEGAEIDVIFWSQSRKDFPWHFVAGGAAAENIPTHWMPLPKPPEKTDE